MPVAYSFLTTLIKSIFSTKQRLPTQMQRRSMFFGPKKQIETEGEKHNCESLYENYQLFKCSTEKFIFGWHRTNPAQ